MTKRVSCMTFVTNRRQVSDIVDNSTRPAMEQYSLVRSVRRCYPCASLSSVLAPSLQIVGGMTPPAVAVASGRLTPDEASCLALKNIQLSGL